MLTTSVNDSGSVPLNEYDDIYAKYSSLVDKIYKIRAGGEEWINPHFKETYMGPQ